MFNVVGDGGFGVVGGGGGGGGDNNIEIIGVELESDFSLGENNNFKMSCDGGVGSDAKNRLF